MQIQIIDLATCGYINGQKSNFVDKNLLCPYEMFLRMRSKRERMEMIDLHLKNSFLLDQFVKKWLFSAKRHMTCHVTCQKHQFYF